MRRAAALAALVAAGLTGCAPIRLVPYAPDALPTVHVPAAAAGVRDVRSAFATLFAREFAAQTAQTVQTAHSASTPSGPGPVGQWLHGVSAAPPGSDPAALDARYAARRSGTVVLFVNGLFGDCLGDQSVPFGDGVPRTLETEPVAAYAGYADLGLRGMRMVPLPGRRASADNGRELAAVIRAEAGSPGVERIVLVAYSKGMADTVHALEVLAREGGVPPQLAAVVSVAGVVMGSPIADRFEALYASIGPGVELFHCSRSDGAEVASVSRRVRTAWAAAHPLPRGIAYYSIVGYVDEDEMAPALRPGHRLLAAIDPRNDGQLVAADAIVPGSELLATARSDHWDIALPRDRDPNPLLRGLTSGRGYPREALLRAAVKWVVGHE